MPQNKSLITFLFISGLLKNFTDGESIDELVQIGFPYYFYPLFQNIFKINFYQIS
jgi:hypothetical protein